MSSITFKSYIIIAVVTTGVLYLLGIVAGPALTNFFEQMRAQAVAVGLSPNIGSLIVEPMKFAINTETIVGPLIMGLMWPVGAVLLFFFLAMVVYSVLSPGLGTAADQIS